MKSFRAAALRLILPLLFRWATVDFFGTDVFDFFTEDFVEVLLGFGDVLLSSSRKMTNELMSAMSRVRLSEQLRRKARSER